MPFPGIPDPQEAGIPTAPDQATDLLRGALAPLVDPVDASLHAILEYGRLLLAANTVTNLTGAKDWNTLVEAHLLDCVLAARYLPERVRTLFDWGSGGGLPGLVWAGIFPERHFHLCERNLKKAEFLEAAASALGYLHVDVVQGQGEEFVREVDPRADLIVARAVEPLPKFLRRLARPGVPPIGLMLMAGRSWEMEWDGNEELQGIWHLDKVDRYPLSEDRGDRFALHLRRKAR
ncbi:MAG: 16S rRNA (guanine(527)-N(7))-methyltransferase RsmG [Planctomycetota bacterium]|jgi:16S rRNA (guanine(527)-N(7))-methyltransferase RsmG